MQQKREVSKGKRAPTEALDVYNEDNIPQTEIMQEKVKA